MNTKEARKKAIETNKNNNGGVLSCNTPESRLKAKFTRSKKFIINDCMVAVSVKGLFDVLISLGYVVTDRQVKSLVEKTGTNYKILKIYPELRLDEQSCIFREISTEEFYKIKGEII